MDREVPSRRKIMKRDETRVSPWLCTPSFCTLLATVLQALSRYMAGLATIALQLVAVHA